MPLRKSSIVARLRRSKPISDVPRRVRAFREATGMTQEELGARSGLNQKYISETETGKINPSIQRLTQIVERGLDLPLSAFFAAEGPSGLRDDLAKLEALFGGQSTTMRRRALRVLRALVDE